MFLSGIPVDIPTWSLCFHAFPDGTQSFLALIVIVLSWCGTAFARCLHTMKRQLKKARVSFMQLINSSVLCRVVFSQQCLQTFRPEHQALAIHFRSVYGYSLSMWDVISK
jgi:hypothetical protein